MTMQSQTGNDYKANTVNMFEEVAGCPNCGSIAQDAIIRNAQDLLVSSVDMTYNVLACKNCGIVYLSPRPKPEFIHLFYPPDEYYPVSCNYHPSPGKSNLIRKLIGAFKEFGRKIVTVPYRVRFGSPSTTFEPFGQGRVLDVGCGSGEYLLSMKALGWEVYGCDISQEKIHYMRQMLGLENTFCATLSELEFPENYFDAITAWHVIEHVYNPSDELRTMYKLLLPGGRLVLGTPNVASLEARFFGKWWIGYEVPRHLVLFCPDTLLGVLEQSGFRISGIRPSLWAASFSDSIAFFSKGFLGRSIWNTWLHRALYYLLYPIASLSYLLGNWGIIEVTAIKQTM